MSISYTQHSGSPFAEHHASYLASYQKPKSMAARSSYYHHLSSSSMAMISPSFGWRKAAFRFSTSAHGSSSSSHLSLAATDKKKVFEDQLRGIVCYRDEKGEMICEGYDEGPRLGMRLPEKACFPWPAEVQLTDFIQLETLRVFEDADVLQLKGDQKSSSQHGTDHISIAVKSDVV